MAKCKSNECLEKDNYDKSDDFTQVFAEKNTILKKNLLTPKYTNRYDLSYNGNSQNPYHDNSNDKNDFLTEETENQGSYVILIKNKLEKIKMFLKMLLKINVQSTEYKTNLMKISLFNEIKNDELKNEDSPDLKEVFSNLKKDLNSKIIINQNTKEISRLTKMINSIFIFNKV